MGNWIVIDLQESVMYLYHIARRWSMSSQTRRAPSLRTTWSSSSAASMASSTSTGTRAPIWMDSVSQMDLWTKCRRKLAGWVLWCPSICCISHTCGNIWPLHSWLLRKTLHRCLDMSTQALLAEGEQSGFLLLTLITLFRLLHKHVDKNSI